MFFVYFSWSGTTYLPVLDGQSLSLNKTLASTFHILIALKHTFLRIKGKKMTYYMFCSASFCDDRLNWIPTIEYHTMGTR